MSDRDWYTAHVRLGWRGVARRVEQGEDFARVGDLCLKALTRTLREARGVHCLDAMVGVVCDYPAGEIAVPEAFAALRSAALSAGGSDLTNVAERAAESTIVRIDHGEIRSDLAREVRCRFIELALDSFLFGPARQRWVGSRFSTAHEAREWQRECISLLRPRIARLADAMARHPSGYRLRTPSRVYAREKTADLLFQPVAQSVMA